jgi:two-component system, LuxR family, sensor kinase FixL
MLSTTKTRRAPARPPAAKAPTRPALSAELLQACEGWAQLGDAAALIDAPTHTLDWVSPAWLALWPTLNAGAERPALDQTLPGLTEALAAACDGHAQRRAYLGDAQQWELQIAPVGTTHLLLRATDRHEQTRALQRQLDDREQLLFTSRVFSVGEMATTLAHELNQPIGATANLLRGLRSRLSRRSSAMNAEEAQALDRAIEQVMFAARVIQRIREFTHSHQPRHARIDLTAMLRASASLLDWDLRRSRARLTLELPQGALHVRGDEVMLQQVVVNLMRNGLDAMRADPPEHPELSVRLIARASDVEVQVCDNGCGLNDETAAKLFVPFASSKPTGMGIGLSICRSFVELHQGRLWFTRNAERGATFHVSLPLTAAAATAAANATSTTDLTNQRLS